MCSVSDKIVLCTCKVSNVENLKHYWMLFRYNPEKGEIIVGQPISWETLLQINNPDNPKILLKKLNEQNIFDKPLEFFEKDRLLISVQFRENECRTDYGFEYKKGKWKIKEFDYFGWMAEHYEFKEGKIKNAVARGK